MYKILVVDDDFEILKLMRTILEMKNYQVTTYQEVTAPININNFKGFDLILLDVMMRIQSGFIFLLVMCSIPLEHRTLVSDMTD